ncbi:Uncharacterised protein [uncultured archaeon]|nr:Uncharacterised protein [uncultured archaeon]
MGLKQPWIYVSTVALAVMVVSAAVLFWPEPGLAFSFMLLGAIVAIAIGNPLEDAALFVLTAIFGCLAEIVCITSGAWAYAIPQAFGMPYWLPFAWGTAALFITRSRDAIFAFGEWLPSLRGKGAKKKRNKRSR